MRLNPDDPTYFERYVEAGHALCQQLHTERYEAAPERHSAVCYSCWLAVRIVMHAVGVEELMVDLEGLRGPWCTCGHRWFQHDSETGCLARHADHETNELAEFCKCQQFSYTTVPVPTNP